MVVSSYFIIQTFRRNIPPLNLHECLSATQYGFPFDILAAPFIPPSQIGSSPCSSFASFVALPAWAHLVYLFINSTGRSSAWLWTARMAQAALPGCEFACSGQGIACYGIRELDKHELHNQQKSLRNWDIQHFPRKIKYKWRNNLEKVFCSKINQFVIN